MGKIVCQKFLTWLVHIICYKNKFVQKKNWTYTFFNSVYILLDAFYVKCTLEMKKKKKITPGGNDDETYLHFNKKSLSYRNEGRKAKKREKITISVGFFFSSFRWESNTTMFAQETYYSFEYKWSLMSLNFYENIRRKEQ